MKKYEKYEKKRPLTVKDGGCFCKHENKIKMYSR